MRSAVIKSGLSMTKPTRGGARPNAGRPKVADKVKSHTICLRDAHWRKFKELGGVSWLRLLLDNDQ